MPLCVDLDGTLITADLLWESCARLAKNRPLDLFAVPLWLAKGRANLKRQLASRVTLDAASLPYNEPFIEYLRTEKSAGRRLLLVTASDRELAEKVSAHLGLFDEVMGSDGLTNLKSTAKAEALVARFGEKGFDYAGDSSADLAVWPRARGALLVGAQPLVARQARAKSNVLAEFPRPTNIPKAIFRLLRPHQWVKNVLVFVPLITSHLISQPPMLWAGIRAFAALCFCASSVYVVNDLLDLDADRRHPTKRRRPLASGALPLPIGFMLGPVLVITAFVLATMVSGAFVIALGVYAVTAFSYAWWLKHVPLLDVFVLAGLYTLRVIAGHAATGVEYSDWLLAFSLFMFLSLALVKRFQELQQAMRASTTGSSRARGYRSEDLPLLAPLGVASGYLGALVLALYVNSDKVRILYHRPTFLLLICPMLLYWISRVWLISNRGGMNDDPVVFALKDPQSYVIAALSVGALWAAT